MPTPVVCAIICNENRILVCRRSLEKTQGGLWEFPGGKIHHGEKPEQALQREIKEELGVSVAVGEFVTRSIHAYDHGSIELSAYRCTLTDGTLKPTEHEEIRWVTINDTTKLEWAPADVPILRSLAETFFHS
jgi:8-oxo-dGTP diphosphatase